MGRYYGSVWILDDNSTEKQKREHCIKKIILRCKKKKNSLFNEERKSNNNFLFVSLFLSGLLGVCLCLLDTWESKELQEITSEEPALIKQEHAWTSNLKFIFEPKYFRLLTEKQFSLFFLYLALILAVVRSKNNIVQVYQLVISDRNKTVSR